MGNTTPRPRPRWLQAPPRSTARGRPAAVLARTADRSAVIRSRDHRVVPRLVLALVVALALVACGGSESATDAEEFAELNAGRGASELVFPDGSTLRLTVLGEFGSFPDECTLDLTPSRLNIPPGHAQLVVTGDLEACP